MLVQFLRQPSNTKNCLFPQLRLFDGKQSPFRTDYLLLGPFTASFIPFVMSNHKRNERSGNRIQEREKRKLSTIVQCTRWINLWKANDFVNHPSFDPGKSRRGFSWVLKYRVTQCITFTPDMEKCRKMGKIASTSPCSPFLPFRHQA